jgi:uncharacterized protein YbjT (DUF2867 family)
MVFMVTGASGNIGGRVAQRLIERGERPRVLTRNADKVLARLGARAEIIAGDPDDRLQLSAAMRGVEAAFLLSAGPELVRLDALAAEAARDAGVRRLVKLSALGARAKSDSPTAVALWHAQGEAAIQASGVPYTFLQPVGFMSNALEWARSIKTQRVVRASTGEGRIAMIHPDDVADVAVEALTTSTHEGQALVITGPQALSYAEMVSKLSAAIDQPLSFEAISDERARTNLLGFGLDPELADALVVLWSEVRAGLVSVVTQEVERVTGHPARCFDQWAAENAAAFSSR